MKAPLDYASRARAAHTAAEAAPDPRDKAAWKAAARTWEQLAKPATGTTYSMEPHRQQLAALKRDVADAIDAPVDEPQARLVESTQRVAQRYPAAPAAIIEF